MTMERRAFLEKAAALGAGLFAASEACSREKAVPSNPGTSRIKAAGPEVIELVQFEKDSTFTLEHALVNRSSDRSFIEERLSEDNISRLLWAMTGVNRPNGHRTTPSAVAKYPVDVYVCIPEGTYMYETKNHRLVRVLSEDIRRNVPTIQPGLKRAAMTIVYVANVDKVPGGEKTIRFADIEIGCMVQNLYLSAASLGLGSCVFGLVKYGKVSELLGLKDDQLVRIAQAVGPIKK